MQNRPSQGAGETLNPAPAERAPSSRRWRGIAGLVVALVVLLAVVVVAFDVGLPWGQGGAPAMVRQLCADEMHQNYAAVYQLLSSQFVQQHSLNQERFVQLQQGRDGAYSPVRSCGITAPAYDATLAHFHPAFWVKATLDGDQYRDWLSVTDTGIIELVYDHGWKISSDQGIDDVLYLASGHA